MDLTGIQVENFSEGLQSWLYSSPSLENVDEATKALSLMNKLKSRPETSSSDEHMLSTTIVSSLKSLGWNVLDWSMDYMGIDVDVIAVFIAQPLVGDKWFVGLFSQSLLSFVLDGSCSIQDLEQSKEVIETSFALMKQIGTKQALADIKRKIHSLRLNQLRSMALALELNSDLKPSFDKVLNALNDIEEHLTSYLS